MIDTHTEILERLNRNMINIELFIEGGYDVKALATTVHALLCDLALELRTLSNDNAIDEYYLFDHLTELGSIEDELDELGLL